MKRHIRLAILLVVTLLCSNEARSSHGMGGELTWTCLNNGQFKFHLKFYRDCSGVYPGTVSLTTTVPGLPTISMFAVQINDVSPKGFVSSGSGAGCQVCANGTPNVGLVQEYIYESDTITLIGTPPPSGWEFYWGECCRSAYISNIINPGSIGFRIRAIMYPFNVGGIAQSASPCFDSSPQFAERPYIVICSGYPFQYYPGAMDPELDSLSFEWTEILDELGSVVVWAPGYNVNSQLPSSIQNNNNVSANLNSSNGAISFTSFTGGYFATVVKVTAYKCNTKVAEIFREVNVVLNNICPTTGGQVNMPPVISPPFTNPATGLYTSYVDTVYAGDTVQFQIGATDFQAFNNGTPQTITIEAFGGEFGTGFSDSNAGCLIAPCATLTPSNPTLLNPNLVNSGQMASFINFHWVTTPQHVLGLDTNCLSGTNTYYFVFKAYDNYCPANAYTNKIVTIVVLDSLINSTIAQASNFEFNITLFPNPASESLHMKMGPPVMVKEIRVIDELGRVINEQSPNMIMYNYRINISNLATGIYNLQINTNDGLANRKFVKMK